MKLFAKIFPLFLLIWSASAAPELEIFSDGSPDALQGAEEVRSFFREITRLRPKMRSARTELKVTFTPSDVPGRLESRFGDYRWELRFGAAGEFYRNHAFMTRLGAVLAAAAENAPPPVPGSALPSWTVSGWLYRRKLNAGFCRMIPGNRYFPVSRVFLERNQFPDLCRILSADPATLSVAEALWFQELSALFLFHVEKNSFYSAAAVVPPGSEMATEHMEEFSAAAARPLVWHYLAPRPAEHARREWNTLTEIPLPELDSNGNPTEKTTPCRLTDAPEKWAGRKDLEELRRSCAEQISRFRNGVSWQLDALSRRLVRETLLLGTVRANPDRFRSLCGEIEAELAHSVKVEQLLFRMEKRYISVVFHSRFALDAAAVGSEEILSDRGKQFLNSIEKVYLD